MKYQNMCLDTEFNFIIFNEKLDHKYLNQEIGERKLLENWEILELITSWQNIVTPKFHYHVVRIQRLNIDD